MTPFDLEISSFSTRLSRLKEKLAWTKRSKKGARFLRCVCNLRQRPVWPTGFFFNQTTLGVYSSRDEDWLRTNGRLGQTSPPLPILQFCFRPAGYLSSKYFPVIFPFRFFFIVFQSPPDIDRSFYPRENAARSFVFHCSARVSFPPPSLPPHPSLPPSSNLQGKLAAKHFQLSVDF